MRDSPPGLGSCQLFPYSAQERAVRTPGSAGLQAAAAGGAKSSVGRKGRIAWNVPEGDLLAYRVSSAHEANSMTVKPSRGGSRQIDDGKPRVSEEDIQREQLGPRGVPSRPDPAKMTPQREKKTPKNIDPGHTT
jgi:hypothetical protein